MDILILKKAYKDMQWPVYKKNCSASLGIRETQGKTTRKYHYVPRGMSRVNH
jgi:hypothetical protein